MTFKSKTKATLAGLGWNLLRLGGRDPDKPRISVIMYHSVGSRSAMSLDPAAFSEQMAQIRQLFPTIRTAGELGETTQPVREWTACITFDDGYADNHEIILPILQQHGLRGTFFICSGFISGEHDITKTFVNYRDLRPMSWNQIKELQAEGMEIGAHTHSHPLLTTLHPELQLHEMKQSKEMIEDKVSQPVSSFAIPFGNRGTYTDITLRLAAKLFEVCCTTRFSTNPALPTRLYNMLLLNRVEPKRDDSARTFVNKARGRWDAMKWLQRKRHIQMVS